MASFDPPVWLLIGLSWGVFLVPIGWLMFRAIARSHRWTTSADAREIAYLEQVGLVASARVRHIEPAALEPVLEVRRYSTGRGRSRRTETHERVGVRLVVELLAVGAPQPIVVERQQTVRQNELPQLAPGAFVQVLYDPRQPARFFLDTVERPQMITAATLRTQQAVQQQAAAQQWASFSPR